MQNTLQINKNNQFMEIAIMLVLKQIELALLFDMDNDGYKDIYVCNGIYHDLIIKILLISLQMNSCRRW
jgi:hypothetical protein